VTVREVARRLEISISLTYKLIDSGKLRCRRHGLGRGVIRVSEDQLADYLASAESEKRPSQSEPPTPRVRLKHLRL
jgi:excisionase family DNA binding protein